FISSNNLLNILIPNDNKVLKEALKEADSKTLEQMVKNNSGSVNDVLKNLFENLKNGTKSNASIENMLKNTSALKDLGNVSTNLSNLLESVSKDESLQKFKPILESFLKNIKDMDANTLKEQLKNSGVFLESKLATTPNAKLENILTQIQNLVKEINTPQAKQVGELLTKLLQTPQNQANSTNADFTNNLKSLTTALQNLNTSLTPSQTQNLSTLTNQLKTLVNTGTLVESKIENSVPLDRSVQSSTQRNIQPNTQAPIQNLKDTLSSLQNLQSKDILTAQIKENPNTLLQNIQIKDSINVQTKDLLLQIKADILQNPTLQNRNILPMIDNLLKMPDLFTKAENLQNLTSTNNLSTFSNNFMSNLSPLLTTLKENLELLNPSNSNLQNHLTKLVDKVEHLIQDLVNNPKGEVKVAEDMKTVLLKMQDELATKTDVKSQDLAKQVDKLLTQIDYHQLASLTSNANNVYLPFLWEMLEDGNISMKKTEEEKFYCQINLTLKDFGKVDLMLALYDKNKLDLTIYAQREHFKIALRDNMQQLKVALNSVDLIPVNIKLLDLKEEKGIVEEPVKIYANNGYNDNFNSSSKIDIRV
ncbi:MAG: flagellar hook-length control protein FliK, partial [Aliarcobacter sp.]|nr:flagellar hook-length control protein FliK [Aliarcobacter sp.]